VRNVGKVSFVVEASSQLTIHFALREQQKRSAMSSNSTGSAISYDRMDGLLHRRLMDRGGENRQVPLSSFYFYLEKAEAFAFLVVGCGVWSTAVVLVLKWLKFPFYAYLKEVFLIIVVPMFLMAVLFKVLDRMVAANAKRE